jgi:hypothetical protein
MIALGLLAFIAILALVLDGGNAYAAKRQAQNAADAGALAGATAMCKAQSESAGETAAITYAVSNGAVNPPLVDVSLSSATVVVTATVTKDTFFAGVIGFPQVSPVAVAEAACQTPVGMGVLPVAWACRQTVLGGMNLPGIDCAQKIYNVNCFNKYNGECTYILMDSVKVKDNKKGGNCDPDVTDPTDPKFCYSQNDLVCSAPDPNDCSYVAPNTTDCDLNNDCVDELMTGGARSWLDLNGGGGGASELTNWIKNGFPDPIPPHSWLPEESGVATSIFHTAAASVVGKDVVLPVFNKVCDQYPNIWDPNFPNESTSQCTYGSHDIMTATGNNMNFHVWTFSEFHVTCVQTGKNKVTAETGYQFNNHKNNCNGHNSAVSNGSIDDNDKTIEGYFIKYDIGGYGGSGSFNDAGVFTVILIR